MAILNVVDFGAVGNGSNDDRTAIQNAIDAANANGGGIVYFPAGTWLVGRNGSNYYCLSVPTSVELVGGSREGSVIKQAASIASSVRLLYVSGDDIRIADLTLDGNKANQEADEQRHGIFAESTQRLTVERVNSRNFTGDGFYLYTSANHSTFSDVYATGNDRNGLTFGGGGLTGCTVIGSRFIGNEAQQIDSEPGGVVQNIGITNCFLDGNGASNDCVLTCSGYSATTRGQGWSICGNTINGPVYIVWCDDVTFAGNSGVNASSDKDHVRVYRHCNGVAIVGNHLHCTQTATTEKATIAVQGTGGDDAPSGVVIDGNVLQQDYGYGFGIYVTGAIDCTISNNKVLGAGATGYWGIYIRATLETHFRSARVIGNYVRNFGISAVAIGGSGAYQLLAVDVSHNTFDSTVSNIQTVGISFDDGTGAAKKVCAIGNKCIGNTTNPISNYPTGPLLIGGTYGERGLYSITGTPEAALTEEVGAMALRRDGGSGTTLYVKESGAGNTGWVAK